MVIKIIVIITEGEYMGGNHPIKHHYIPKFLLRQFCNETGSLNYCDLETGKITMKKPEEIFMIRNLYRDKINHPEDPTKIEKTLAVIENKASTTIKKFLVGNKIEVSVKDIERLKVFLALMTFRANATKKNFGEDITPESEAFYKMYQEDGDFNDFWKRNLGLLAECELISDITTRMEIDDPIAIFFVKDVVGPFGKYFVIAERQGKEDFLLTDAYPTIIGGTDPNGIRADLYSVFPISPKRVLLLVNVGVKYAKTGFSEKFFSEPVMSKDRETYTFQVKGIHESRVKMLNKSLYETAHEGAVFQDRKRISII